MPNPNVSFVCTFYNKAAFVPTVLASIKSQRGLGDVEYIFVDDGSTDNTLQLLQDITRDWSNCHIVTQKNGGQTAATITGLKMVTKEFVKTWDGDDFAHPDLTRKLVDACQQYNVGYAYCIVDFSIYEAPTNYQEMQQWMETLPVPQPILKKNYLKRVLHAPITNPTGCLFRKTLMDKMRLPDPRVVIPDVYMSYCAALFSDFAFLASPMAFAFRHVPGRLTSNEAQIMHDLNAALACFYDNFYDDLDYSEKLFACQRAAGRARLWARRRHGQGITSSYGRMAIKARCGLLLEKYQLFQSCAAFRQGDAKVRIGPHMLESMEPNIKANA